jgi:hypothetical protein
MIFCGTARLCEIDRATNNPFLEYLTEIRENIFGPMRAIDLH